MEWRVRESNWTFVGTDCDGGQNSFHCYDGGAASFGAYFGASTTLSNTSWQNAMPQPLSDFRTGTSPRFPRASFSAST